MNLKYSVNFLINETKFQYYKSQVDNNSSNSKNLWDVINNITRTRKSKNNETKKIFLSKS